MRAAPAAAQGRRVIHISPERGVVPVMRARFGQDWTPCDIDPDRYNRPWLTRKAEWTDLSRAGEIYPPGSVHGFVHSHVLEHVPAPLDVFLPEMNAAIAPGGFHAFIVPGPFPPRYREDLEGRMSKQERLEQFGHRDHVRLFGSDDWSERVERHFEGFTRVPLETMITEEECHHAGVPVAALKRLTGKTVHLWVRD